MSKFKVGDMVRIVRFDLSDARGSLRWIGRNGSDASAYFKVLKVDEDVDDSEENSVCVDIISTHWYYPEDCLELQPKDSFRRRLAEPNALIRHKCL